MVPYIMLYHQEGKNLSPCPLENISKWMIFHSRPGEFSDVKKQSNVAGHQEIRDIEQKAIGIDSYIASRIVFHLRNELRKL